MLSILYALIVVTAAPTNGVVGLGLESVAIDAPGVASKYAWKGFPNAGIAPKIDKYDDAVKYSKANPGFAPLGTNPSTCTIKQGTAPIVLIPGTGEDAVTAWSYYGPRLSDAGFCVYTFNHNPRVIDGETKEHWAFSGDITESAAALSTFVDSVLALTGAPKVHLVGHSQGGGILPDYYLKFLGGAAKVDKVIAIAGDHYGTNRFGIAILEKLLDFVGIQGLLNDGYKAFNMMALPQQIEGSDLLKKIAHGGIPQPGVNYTNIATRFDDVVLPYTNTWMKKDSDHGTYENVLLQDYCGIDFTNHHGFCYDQITYQIVENALTGENKDIPCKLVLP